MAQSRPRRRSQVSGSRRYRVPPEEPHPNQLLGQLDRAFPGLTLALPDVLGTKVGRLVAEQFADPARLAALGPARFVRFAAARGLQVGRPLADRLVAAARDALPTADALIARRVLAADLRLLHELEQEVTATEQELAILLPDSPFADVDHGARLGRGPRRELRRRPRRPGPLARPGADLPRLRAVPGPVRIRRAAPRRRDQPGRQRRVAPRADRSRCRAVAVRPRGQGLRRRAEGPRQEEAGSSPARWRTAPPASRTPWSATNALRPGRWV